MTVAISQNTRESLSEEVENGTWYEQELGYETNYSRAQERIIRRKLRWEFRLAGRKQVSSV